MTNAYFDSTHTSASIETAEHPRVIGIHGAIEHHGIASDALTETLTGAANADAATDFIDLSKLEIPLYNSDHSEPHDAMAVKSSVAHADAMLLATSVRHNSYSTQLKTTLEYCDPDDFIDKPVGLLGIGTGAVSALEQLRTICTTLTAEVLPTQVSIEMAEREKELSAKSIPELRTLGQQAVDQLSHNQETVPKTSESRYSK